MTPPRGWWIKNRLAVKCGLTLTKTKEVAAKGQGKAFCFPRDLPRDYLAQYPFTSKKSFWNVLRWFGKVSVCRALGRESIASTPVVFLLLYLLIQNNSSFNTEKKQPIIITERVPRARDRYPSREPLTQLSHFHGKKNAVLVRSTQQS